MNTGRQFSRYYEVLIDDIRIKGSTIDFTAVRSLDTIPNTLELSITNLGDSKRTYLQEHKNQVVQLTAGYEDHYGVIYLGECRAGVSRYQRPDWVTDISSGDGERQLAESRINKSFLPGVSYETVVLEVANSLGDVGLGNLKKILKKGKLPGGGQSFPNGITVSGPSKKELKKLMISSGLEWSVQNRQLQVLEANKSLGDIAYRLTPDSGLIGSPVLDNLGNLECRALLNPDIVPGRQIELDSRYVKGRFRATRCVYTGNSVGGPWYVDIEGEKIIYDS